MRTAASSSGPELGRGDRLPKARFEVRQFVRRSVEVGVPSRPLLVPAKGGLCAMLRRELQLREDCGQLVAEQAFRLLQRGLVDLDGLLKDVMQSCLLVRHPQPQAVRRDRFDKAAEDARCLPVAMAGEIDRSEWQGDQRPYRVVSIPNAMRRLVEISDDHAAGRIGYRRVEWVARQRCRTYMGPLTRRS